MCDKDNWFSDIIRDENHEVKKEYVLPITVEHDSDYRSMLQELMTELKVTLKGNDETAKYASIVSVYEDFFLRILDAQYAGDLTSAQNIAQEILDDLKSKDDAVAFSPIKRCIAFTDMEDVFEDEGVALDDDDEASTIQFFRARTSDTYTKFTRLEMLHVPFNKRQYVSNARFSISGFPCLYLGSSSYCCWLELGTPEPQHFNVSYVQINESKEILNLTMNAYDFEHCVDLKVSEEKTVTSFKLWLLCIATSFIVKEKERVFKSEYVIPQLIMLACKNSGYYGISYYSKRVGNDLFADHVCVNLAIFAFYNGELKISDICKDIKLTNSMNFEMFKNLKPSLTYRHEYMNVTNSTHPINIGDFERPYPYRETEFYAFDEYLAAHLNDELQAIDLTEANSRP